MDRKRFIAGVLILIFMISMHVLNVMKAEAQGVYDAIRLQVQPKDGVKEISYKQFMEIRNSGEGYTLLDVLPKVSYQSGHIEGAKSLPANEINLSTAKKILSKDSKIIVYCASFQCRASSNAAKKLQELGYTVLDYKGGIGNWVENGNKLVK